MDGRGVEVASGIHRIEAPLGERYVACYLVVGTAAALLVDTGIEPTPAGTILPYLGSIGLSPEAVRWVVVTHADVDHMGGDAALAAAVPGAVLVAGRLDRELIEDVDRIVVERYSEFAADHGIDVDDGFKAWCREIARAARIDLALDGRCEIALGGRTVEVFPTPGHSRGSISVWDPTTRAAMIGDAVLGPTVRARDGRAAFPPTYRYLEPYRATIDELARRAPDLLLTSHDPVMDAAAAQAFLVESRAYTDRLDQLALATLARATGPLTTQTLVERLAPSMGTWPTEAWMFLANGLVGHLEAAEAGGLVRRVGGSPVGWEVVA